MKRAREPKQGVADALYIVSGCVCYTGQGYSPCDCPNWVEATENEYARCSTWTYDDVRHMISASENRTSGNIVQWKNLVLVKPCAKGTLCHEALVKYNEFSVSVMYSAESRPRFVAAYFMNGDFFFWPTNNLEEVLDYMDMREGACRSTINAAVFVDREEKRTWCYEDGCDWKSLLKNKEELGSCRVSSSKK